VPVKVLYFASFRDVSGRESEERAVSPGARVGDLWRELVAEMPALARTGNTPPAAVNSRYTGHDSPLSDGDEVAFLPPVAGG
jgi:molybdopterin converting factor subunit 1